MNTGRPPVYSLTAPRVRITADMCLSEELRHKPRHSEWAARRVEGRPLSPFPFPLSPFPLPHASRRILGQFCVMAGHSAPGRDASGASYVAHSEIAVDGIPGDAGGEGTRVRYTGRGPRANSAGERARHALWVPGTFNMPGRSPWRLTSCRSFRLRRKSGRKGHWDGGVSFYHLPVRASAGRLA